MASQGDASAMRSTVDLGADRLIDFRRRNIEQKCQSMDGQERKEQWHVPGGAMSERGLVIDVDVDGVVD